MDVSNTMLSLIALAEPSGNRNTCAPHWKTGLASQVSVQFKVHSADRNGENGTNACAAAFPRTRLSFNALAVPSDMQLNVPHMAHVSQHCWLYVVNMPQNDQG
jgi:hypothetical protein